MENIADLVATSKEILWLVEVLALEVNRTIVDENA